MATSTERSRRLRKHRSGDHSLCLPERCGAARGTDATPNATPVAPAPVEEGPRAPRLRARGRRMWDQLIGDDDPIEVVVLVEEICRCADRLDRLDAILNGRDREWIRLELPEGEAVIEVVVDKVLAEGRQQQTTFKALLSELRAIRGASTKNTGRGRAPQGSKGGGGGVADLTALIAAKRRPAG